jgi:hypothetical protein
VAAVNPDAEAKKLFFMVLAGVIAFGSIVYIFIIY